MEASSFVSTIVATLVVAVPIALLVSLALLRIYRRAVIRSMQQRVTLRAAPGLMGALENMPARSDEPPGHPLEIGPHDPPGDGIRLAVKKVTWPSAAVDVCAGLSYGIVMASSWFVMASLYQGREFLFDWHVFLLMSIVFAWPMVITVGLAIAVSWRGFAILVVGYVLVLAGVAAPKLVSTDVTTGQLLMNWLNVNGPGTLVALAFLATPIRAVGLLVLVFTIAVVGGAFAIGVFFSDHPEVLSWVDLGVFYGAALLLLLTSVVASGIIGWLLLRWIATSGTAGQQLTKLALVFVIAGVEGVFAFDIFFDQDLQVLSWGHLSIFYGAALLLLLTSVVATGIIGWLLLRWLASGVTAGQQLTNWLNVNPPGRLRALALARPISAVVVFMIVAVTAAILIHGLFEIDEQTPLLGSMIIRLGFYLDFAALLLVGAVPTGIVGWLLLRWLGSLYLARRISDQSLTIDAVWLMFSYVQSPVPESARLEVSGALWIGAFVAYKLTATAGFRLVRTRAEKDAQALKLLVLRVFSLGTRSERLFAGFTMLWRHMGSVQLIAGPDLATSTVEPHEFLDFLAGRLQRRFITGPDTLEQRLSETEQRRDVDGRFRITDFFCHDDTWQMVFNRLKKDSDVVLMDLRGFSQSNQGCVFEIKELLDGMLLRHIVFVIDRTTDGRFLAQVFVDAWATVTKASPNWNDPAPRVRLYRFDGHAGQNIPALVAVVANAGMHYPMRNEA